MKVRISETGQEVELKAVVAGVNWAQEIIGNAGATIDGQFTRSDDGEWVCDAETYTWWVEELKERAKEMEAEREEQEATNGEQLQSLFRAISGYEGPGAAWTSAKDERWATLRRTGAARTELIEHLRGYADNVLSLTLTDAECSRVCEALIEYDEADNANDNDHAYAKLGGEV